MQYKDSLFFKGRQTRETNNLTAICEPIVSTKCDNFDISESYGPPRLVIGTALPLIVTNCFVSYESQVWRMQILRWRMGGVRSLQWTKSRKSNWKSRSSGYHSLLPVRISTQPVSEMPDAECTGFPQSRHENFEIIFLIRPRPLLFTYPEYPSFTVHHLTRHYVAWAAATKTRAINTADAVATGGNVTTAAAAGQYGSHLRHQQQRLCCVEVKGHIQSQRDELRPLTQNSSPSGHNRTHQKTSANRNLCYPIPLQVRGGRWEAEWTNEKPPIRQPW
jgi:hypothetical protein